MKMLESDNYNKTDLHIYQQLIGKLMYLAYGTKTNIAFVVKQLSKHNAGPKERYL